MPRFGGACPRWNVYDAFATPGLIRTQVSRMPDGSFTMSYDHAALLRSVQLLRPLWGRALAAFVFALLAFMVCALAFAAVISVLAGLLWDSFGASWTFYAGALFCLVALAGLARRNARQNLSL